MNYITGKHLSRRTFLKGVGAALALPMLDSMTPAAAAARAIGGPTRMCFIYLPNGVIMDEWTPEASLELNLSRTLAPLAKHRDNLNVFTGLAQLNGRALGDGAGDHARAAASYLTGVHPYKTSGADIKLDISVDQVAAERIGDLTRLPSLETTLERGRLAGNCDSGYSCAYSNSISWRGEKTPNPPEHNPRQVFERLFGGFDANASKQERDRERKFRNSVLDIVSDDTKKLMRKLGKTDQQKMDEYLYAVRKLEQRIESAEQLEKLNLEDLSTPPEERPSDFVEYARMMADLQVLAFRTDQTRIITMMIGGEGSNRKHTEIDIKEGHHEMSHHKGDEEKIENLRRVNVHHMEQVAYFVDQLSAVEEEESNLLYRSMILCGSGLSDGNRHQHHNLPVVMAGKGNGTIKTGRHLMYEDEVPMNNLFLSMLDRMGVPTETLGDSTGRLEHLSNLSG